MFPDPDHLPSGLKEEPIRLGIADTVGLHLILPECSVGCRSGVMDGASMPKTSINEDCNLGTWK
jgi:hypothetical protein